MESVQTREEFISNAPLDEYDHFVKCTKSVACLLTRFFSRMCVLDLKTSVLSSIRTV